MALMKVDKTTEDRWLEKFKEIYPSPEHPLDEDTEESKSARGEASFACLLACQAANPNRSYKEPINFAKWRTRVREYSAWRDGLWERVKVAYQHNPFQTMRCIDAGDLKPWWHM